MSSVDEYDYTTSERGPTYEYEEKVRSKRLVIFQTLCQCQILKGARFVWIFIFSMFLCPNISLVLTNPLSSQINTSVELKQVVNKTPEIERDELVRN